VQSDISKSFGGNHLIFANYKKAYGTRGCEGSKAWGKATSCMSTFGLS
jgi:hypothetical protein